MVVFLQFLLKLHHFVFFGNTDVNLNCMVVKVTVLLSFVPTLGVKK